MAEIILDRVSKHFPDGTVTLQEVSFTIRNGEFFILVGPSGCGKSTLLNLIVGLEAVSAGEIRVDGRTVNKLDPKDRNMAMVFQSYALYPHMSVRENIAFPLRLAKVSNAEIARRVDEAAAILELTPLLERKPASLSGGQRQRVAMGRAIVREPEVFLLDEPLSNLDARLRVQMRIEIARLQKRLGTTLIYVTHDQTEAMTMGDRVAVMNRGKVQQIGTPRELYYHPANLFVAGFMGSPGMNFLPALIDGTRLILPIGETELAEEMLRHLPADCTELIAGIRPEYFRPLEADNISRGELAFDAFIDVLEWSGAELYVYFDVKVPVKSLAIPWPDDLCGKIRENNTLPLVARLPSSVFISKGDKISLLLDTCKIHLFAYKTGKSYTRKLPLAPAGNE
ncbi:Trehalose import ATP-binding protein SugC [Candidatus Methylobacter favarea]|uniref:Trehalose import ATP-binding protein SugC n=1 Tax=Candidatus Methylobacter favarea TaxID=2707345 RepID=A0A8S0X302_9GAMM|nr:sn-glycerol-3-phosphate ABC transporter ATP-binding protein UgpC [Candidatus Methylobacter favarea]CAA9892334.1 Trehalose import ATP-binding protein SugC [Candidatus Methylobacter favarea]